MDASMARRSERPSRPLRHIARPAICSGLFFIERLAVFLYALYRCFFGTEPTTRRVTRLSVPIANLKPLELVHFGVRDGDQRIRPLWLEQELRHTVIAFGGGVLIAAIAFVLVPEGQEYFRSPKLGVVLFLLGGLVFMLVERHLVVAAARTSADDRIASRFHS